MEEGLGVGYRGETWGWVDEQNSRMERFGGNEGAAACPEGRDLQNCVFIFMQAFENQPAVTLMLVCTTTPTPLQPRGFSEVCSPSESERVCVFVCEDRVNTVHNELHDVFVLLDRCVS